MMAGLCFSLDATVDCSCLSTTLNFILFVREGIVVAGDGIIVAEAVAAYVRGM